MTLLSGFKLRATLFAGRNLSDALPAIGDCGPHAARVFESVAEEIMSTLTIQIPESLRKHIEALAAKEGYSVSQFLTSAAGEKLAVMLTTDYLRREAEAGRRQDFDRYLGAVPDVEPTESDRLEP
jgi:hypothetical protein